MPKIHKKDLASSVTTTPPGSIIGIHTKRIEAIDILFSRVLR